MVMNDPIYWVSAMSVPPKALWKSSSFPGHRYP